MVNDDSSQQVQVEYEFKLHEWNTFEKFCHAIIDIIDEYFVKTYHNHLDASDSQFVTMTPREALTWLQLAYSNVPEEEIMANLQHLFLPMTCDLSVKVMLREVDYIQITAFSFPHSNDKFLDQQFIDAAIMELKGMGGIYTKAIKKWGHMNQMLKTWSDFIEAIHDEYQKMLDGGTALEISASQGNSTAFNATTDTPPTDNDGLSFLADTIIFFTELGAAN